MDWHERSRQLWLKEGDANTKFFHLAASARRRFNLISSVKVEERTVTSVSEIRTEAGKYFKEISKAAPRGSWRMASVDFPCVSDDQRDMLVTPISEQEVLKAIKDLNNEGAPGPNGFQVFFYKELWSVVKVDVLNVIHEFELGNSGFERLNKSYLFLLPKKSCAERFSDYRPIALSNSIYLIISKIIANRLQEVLKDLIMPVQSAFLPGRSLQESFIIA